MALMAKTGIMASTSFNSPTNYDLDSYFEALMRILLKEYRTIDLVEDVWVGGRHDREIYLKMPLVHRMTVHNLNTTASRVFINGVHDREWFYDLHK